MSEPSKPAKAMPKGGRTGGAIFPRMNLETAVGHAKRLVSKTHLGPQAKDIVYSGVLDAKGPTGDIKLSALKQFGFSIGNTEGGFGASEPAKKMASAPPEELAAHLRAAVLRPKIFKSLFDTYHGNVVTRAKLKQRTADLNVHPDQTEACVDIYLQSAQFAGLIVPEGEGFRHLSDSQANAIVEPAIVVEPKDQEKGDIDKDPDGSAKKHEPTTKNSEGGNDNSADNAGNRPRAIFNVNVNLDSSLDTEKLQKQLELLKRFGAI
jgi:hypothetical protein